MQGASLAPPERKRILRNLQSERDSARLYHAMAQAEDDPAMANVFRELARTEEKHAAAWLDKLAEAHEPEPAYKPSMRQRILAALAKRFGPTSVLPFVGTLERRDTKSYGRQDEPGMAADETRHARVLGAIAAGSPGGIRGAGLASLEGRHRGAGGNALRAGVLGANDGLVSNLSLVMGVAGAELGSATILITGLAGLLAGASSMALGEWLSVQSARELYAHQIALERAELRDDPEAEKRELTLIYQSRGIPGEQARAMVDKLAHDEDAFLDALAREELGVDVEELGGSAWQAAGVSFVLFAIGAIVPVVPFVLLGGLAAVAWSVAFSALGLFGLGAAITLFTGRPWWRSGLRQVLFGLAAAALTFGIGRLIGVGLAG